MPPAKPACPDPKWLKLMAQGKVGTKNLAVLEKHLLACDRCARAVRDLAPNKPGVKTSRANQPAAAESPTAPPDSSSVSEAETSDHAAPEPIDFLAPAQGPDELGRLGTYRVLKVLGSGGMGVVFLAEDPQLKRRVALKAMRPALAASASAGQRFLREAQSTAALKHDHVVTIYQVGEDRGVPFLAMELLEGEPLDERLKRKGKLPSGEVLRVGRETAAGLAAAHKRGLLHRDIKPGNLWVEAETGRVKILDFGLARPLGEDTQLTQEGAIIGTPAYMAPEQARGEPVDHRCDLFSLGCVLYRLSTGKLPFVAADAISTLMAVATETPKAPHQVDAEVPRELSDLIVNLMAKKPADRPQSAQAVVEAIRAIEEERTQQLPAPKRATPKRVPAAPRPGPRPRRWWVLGAAVAGLLVLLGGGAWLAGPTLVRLATDSGELTVVKSVQNQGDSPRPASPAAGLKREDIPAKELAAAGGGDPKKAPPQLVAVLGEHQEPDAKAPANAPRLVISPDGSLLAVSQRGSLRVWDLTTTKLILSREPKNVADGIDDLAFSPDGRTLAFARNADGIVLWEVPSGKELRTLPATKPNRIAFRPDGLALAHTEVGADASVKFQDVATGKVWRTLKGVKSASPLGFSPDGKMLAGVGLDSAVKVWDTLTGEELRSLTLPDVRPRLASLLFSPDGKVLATFGQSAKGLWDPATGKPAFATDNTKTANSVSFHPSGKVLVGVCDGATALRFWDVTTGVEQAGISLALPAESGAAFVAYLPDGRHLAVANKDSTVHILRVPSPVQPPR